MFSPAFWLIHRDRYSASWATMIRSSVAIYSMEFAHIKFWKSAKVSKRAVSQAI